MILFMIKKIEIFKEPTRILYQTSITYSSFLFLHKSVKESSFLLVTTKHHFYFTRYT